MRPTGSRAVIDRMAEAIIHDPRRCGRACRQTSRRRCSSRGRADLRFARARSRRSAQTLAQLSAQRRRGTPVVQVVDPAEETFPYSGRVEFLEMPETGAITAGRAGDAGATDYQEPLKRPSREVLRPTRAHRLELHPSTAPTAPAASCCTSCMAASATEQEAAFGRHSPSARRRCSSGGLHDPPLGFAAAAHIAGLLACRCCGGCCGSFRRSPRIEFPPTRCCSSSCPRRSTPVTHAVVADCCCACACGPRDPRRLAGPVWNPPVATTSGAAARVC